MSQTRDEFQALVRLLEAMAEEWALFAADFSALGEALCEEAVADGNLRNAAHIQKLDALGQLVLSQSELLAQIARGISVDSKTPINIESVITSVPFHHSRERLNAALRGGDTDSETPPQSDANVDWF